MSSSAAIRAIRDRFPRRHVRFHGPTGTIGAEARSVLPEVAPVPRTVKGLMHAVISAVNARGMCAAHAARLAELPAGEVESIEALCQCAQCHAKRHT